jgi:stringent starvation protein B
VTGEPTPQRPYLYRALHEWMTDNGYTPHIVVDATEAGARVPTEFVEDGRIVLNVSYSATQGLVLGNDSIEFQARFGGRPFSVSVPATGVLAIYARETGEGMVFGESPEATDAAEAHADAVPVDAEPEVPKSPDRSHLTVIK